MYLQPKQREPITPQNSDPEFRIGSYHQGGLNCLFGDGSVKFIRNSISLRTLRALGTIDRGDIPGTDW